jgi:ADP-ribose pyrophosphatase
MKRLDPWTTLSRTVVFSGGPIAEIAKEAVLLPDGRTVPDFYTVSMGDFALVFAVTRESRVLVLRQYKHGLKRVCLGFPGGRVDSAETPLAAAQRELLEETGYASHAWESLGSYVTNANQGCNTAYLFRATACDRIAEPMSGDLEEAELLTIPPDDLVTVDGVREIGQASHVALLLLATTSKIVGKSCTASETGM